MPVAIEVAASQLVTGCQSNEGKIPIWIQSEFGGEGNRKGEVID
jgi:hypothetical protein